MIGGDRHGLVAVFGHVRSAPSASKDSAVARVLPAPAGARQPASPTISPLGNLRGGERWFSRLWPGRIHPVVATRSGFRVRDGRFDGSEGVVSVVASG